MAINKNHEFEELEGVKCGNVEKDVQPERVEFLKKLLQFNNYTVVAVPSPPPKVAVTVKPGGAIQEVELQGEIPPQTFTVGVTDYTFKSYQCYFRENGLKPRNQPS